jgi:hypothetical protein
MQFALLTVPISAIAGVEAQAIKARQHEKRWLFPFS